MFSFRAFLVFFFLPLLACTKQGGVSQDPPNLVASHTEVEDLGMSDLGRLEIERTIVFVNKGANDVVVAEVSTSCSCTIPKLEFPVTISAGQSFELPVTLIVPSGQRRYRQMVALFDPNGRELVRADIGLNRSSPAEASSYRLKPWILDGTFSTTVTISSHDLTMLSRLKTRVSKGTNGVYLEAEDIAYSTLEDGRFIRLIKISGEVGQSFEGGVSQITVEGVGELSPHFTIDVIPAPNLVETYEDKTP